MTHGLIRVNGERVNIPFYLVQTGAEIQMKESGLQIPDVQELTDAGQPVPGWLERRDGGAVKIYLPTAAISNIPNRVTFFNSVLFDYLDSKNAWISCNLVTGICRRLASLSFSIRASMLLLDKLQLPQAGTQFCALVSPPSDRGVKCSITS